MCYYDSFIQCHPYYHVICSTHFIITTHLTWKADPTVQQLTSIQLLTSLCCWSNWRTFSRNILILRPPQPIQRCLLTTSPPPEHPVPGTRPCRAAQWKTPSWTTAGVTLLQGPSQRYKVQWQWYIWNWILVCPRKSFWWERVWCSGLSQLQHRDKNYLPMPRGRGMLS